MPPKLEMDPDQDQEREPELPPLESSEPPPSEPPQRQARRRRTSSASSSGARGKAKPTRDKAYYLGEIHQMVASTALVGGSALAVRLPATGVTLVSKSAAVGDVTVRLAEKDARVYRVLKQMVDAQIYTEIAMLAAALLVAVAVDARRVEPESPLARAVLPPEAVSAAVQFQGGSDGAGQSAPAANGVRPPGWFGAQGPLEPAPGVSGL